MQNTDYKMTRNMLFKMSFPREVSGNLSSVNRYPIKTFGYDMFLLMFLFTCTLSAANRENFFSHGPSVSAYGRGETAAARSDDLACYYYNPALLSSLKSGGISLAHYSLFEGSVYDYFSFGNAVSGETFYSFSGRNLKSGDIEVRQLITDTPSTIQAGQWLYTASIAGDLNRIGLGVKAGINLNYYSVNMYGYSANAVSVDAGLSKSAGGPDFLGNKTTIFFGFSGQNLNKPAIKLVSEQETYPSVYRFGSAIELPTACRYNTKTKLFSYDVINLSLELVSDTDDNFRYSFGAEYGLSSKYFVRAGLSNNPTFGIGCRLKDLQFDYAIEVNPYISFQRLGFSFYWGRDKV